MSLYFSLLALFLVWNIFRSQGINWVVLAIQCVPLLALLPNLLSRYYRSYSWLCFVIMLYFIVAVMGAFSSAANILDYTFVALCVVIFITSMMCSRYAQRVQKNIQ